VINKITQLQEDCQDSYWWHEAKIYIERERERERERVAGDSKKERGAATTRGESLNEE
jgi:hypothetical protein